VRPEVEQEVRKQKSSEKKPSIELYYHPNSPLRKYNQERKNSKDIQRAQDDNSKNKSTVTYREEDCICKSRASLFFCRSCSHFFPRAKERCVVHPKKIYENSFCSECFSMEIEELQEVKY